MRTIKNLKNILYYHEHSLLDLNFQANNALLFMSDIQIEWQAEMMAKYKTIFFSIDEILRTS